jgi:hypothetical protein
MILLDEDFVLPVVAKVVHVFETLGVGTVA